MLLGISIGNQTVDLPCWKFNTNNTIVDSGTTSLMLPTEVQWTGLITQVEGSGFVGCDVAWFGEWFVTFCGMWCCVVWWVVCDILKDAFSFILKSNQSKKNILFMDWLPFKMLGTSLKQYFCTKLYNIMPQRTVILYSLVGCFVFRCSAWWSSCWTLPLCSTRACLFLMTSCWCRRCYAGRIHWTGLSFPASVCPWLIPATCTLFWICLLRYVVITNMYV